MQEQPEPSPTPSALFMLAREFKDAAVAAKADEAIALLIGKEED